MKRKGIPILIGVICLALIVAVMPFVGACAKAPAPAPVPTPKPVAPTYAWPVPPCLEGPPTATGPWKVCGIVPMSGPVSQYGEYWSHGAELAVEDLKKAGWTGDKSIIYMTEDNQIDPKLSIIGVRRVNAMEDVLMLGTTGSSVTLAMCPLVIELKIPVINVGATSPKIRTESHGWTFSNTPAMDFEAKYAAEYAVKDLKAKTGGVLYVNNEYGLGGLQVFSKVFEEAGGKIVATESHEIGCTDFRTQWTKIKAANPDVVYLCSHDIEGGRALKQKEEMAVPIQVIGGVSTSTAFMIGAAGSGAEGYIGMMSAQDLGLIAEDSRLVDYNNRHIAKYGDPFQYQSVNAYDSILMFADAIKSGAVTRSAIRDYLAAKIKDYPGLSGVYSFDKDAQYDGSMGMCVVKGGKLVPLK